MRGSDDDEALEGLVVALTAEVANRVTAPPPPSFPGDFLGARPIDPTRIGVDDQLDVMIWESEGAGLFDAGSGATVIPAATVDANGGIFIPFAGRQQAAGMTVAELRERIQSALEPLTLSPQVGVGSGYV